MREEEIETKREIEGGGGKQRDGERDRRNGETSIMMGIQIGDIENGETYSIHRERESEI